VGCPPGSPPPPTHLLPSLPLDPRCLLKSGPPLKSHPAAVRTLCAQQTGPCVRHSPVLGSARCSRRLDVAGLRLQHQVCRSAARFACLRATRNTETRVKPQTRPQTRVPASGPRRASVAKIKYNNNNNKINNTNKIIIQLKMKHLIIKL